MSKEYYLGVCAGIAAFVLVFFLICKLLKLRKVKPVYDERQIAAQGKAFKLGFFTLIGWCVLYALLDAFEIRWLGSATVGLFLGILIAAGVYGVYAVRHDAYFGYNESRNSAVLLAVIGGLNALVFLLNLFVNKAPLIADGGLQTPVVNLACALLFAALLLANRIHGAAGEGDAE